MPMDYLQIKTTTGINKMGAGRKPLPTNIHELQGNRRHMSKDALASKIRVAEQFPDSPDYLDDVALEEWCRIRTTLESMGVMSDVDMAALSAYCMSFSRWVTLGREIKAQGMAGLVETDEKGKTSQTALVKVQDQAFTQMFKALAEFGFTPSSRSKVIGSAKTKADEVVKPVDRFFK
jgi:P27 family predicted phage terminase small subunit